MSNSIYSAKSFVFNPKSYDPEKILPPPLRHLSDWSRLLLEIIERRHLALDCIDSQFVCLHSKILKQIVPYIYYPIRKALEDAGVIEVCHSYSVGHHSKGYRLAEPYASMPRTKVELHREEVIKKLVKNKAKYQVVLKNPVHDRLFHWFQQVEVNYSEAAALLDRLKLKGRQRARRELDLLRLVNKDWYFVSDISGRVHNNVVNLAKELRQFLRINGSSLVILDICNSQPLFFSVHLIKHKKVLLPPSPPSLLHYVLQKRTDALYYGHLQSSRHWLPHDMQDWIKLTEQGRLYDWLMAKMVTPYKSRKVFKRKFFEQCFYNEPSDYKAKMREQFKTLFPTVQEAIDELKAEDYKNAPLTLQQQEASFILDTVCKRLFEEHPEMPVLTIHDSILTTPQYQSTAQKVMEEEFMRLGVRPTLKVGA